MSFLFWGNLIVFVPEKFAYLGLTRIGTSAIVLMCRLMSSVVRQRAGRVVQSTLRVRLRNSVIQGTHKSMTLGRHIWPHRRQRKAAWRRRWLLTGQEDDIEVCGEDDGPGRSESALCLIFLADNRTFPVHLPSLLTLPI